jgi:hypothetical protein
MSVARTQKPTSTSSSWCYLPTGDVRARSASPMRRPITRLHSKTCSRSQLANWMRLATRRSATCSSKRQLAQRLEQQLVEQLARHGVHLQHAAVRRPHITIRHALIEPLQETIEVAVHVE